MRLTLLTSIFAAILAGCEQDREDVRSRPDDSDIVGLWRGSQIPSGFFDGDHIPTDPSPTLEIRADGTFVATDFPLRGGLSSPDGGQSEQARLWSGQGNWTLTDGPTPEPEGVWMMNLAGIWVHLSMDDSLLTLVYHISMSHGWRVRYDLQGEDE
ncbi:hypothetical protein [Haloferula sp.]|uniref:hypothetical protein n=1 Tax=Haloferula sp. TaxID=2497595 RepID=UPI003C75AFF7